MVVICESCKASFKLDDSRIPADGIKVRCSKCKHVFMVTREVSEDFLSELESFESFHRGQMAKEETAEGAAEKLARVPEEPAGISFEEFMKKEEPALEPSEPEAPADELISSESEQPEAPLQEGVISEGIDLEPSLASELLEVTGAAPEEASIEQEETELEFSESQPPADELISREFEQPEAPPQEEEGPEQGDLQPSLASELSEVTGAAPEKAPAEQEETALSVEAFFREEMERESEDQAREGALPSLKDKRFEDLIRGKGLAKGPVRRRSSLRAILVLILLLTLGVAAYLWWRDQGASVSLPINIGPTIKMAVEKVSGLWEDVIGFRKESLELSGLEGYEDEIGQHRVYIIKGKVTNKSRRARKYVKLRVIILDQAGNRIKEKVIFCGNVFTREELEKLSPKFFTGEEILEPKRPKDMVLEAHKTISFMAIFSGLPREGKSFKVEKLDAPRV